MLPDPKCTPGATNPAVTPDSIANTICQAGWSASVRPPESITEPQKRDELRSYGYYHGHLLHRYELDHLIPISLGGALDSVTNLWPEANYPEANYPAVSPASYYLNPKDRLEKKLHQLVCSHQMPLARAQRVITRNWVAGYRRYVQ